MTDRKFYLGPLTDNRRWDHIALRRDDVIVVTPPKCGTTWMQTIVALLFTGDPAMETALSMKMPWVDIRFREIDDVAGRLAAQQDRRCMKSHTPMDGLPIHDTAQYICVFRHPLDAHFSFRNHLRNVPIRWFDHWFPDDDPDGITFQRFLDGGPEGFDMDALPLAHILRHFAAAKALALHPNVTLFHYADMLRDLAGTFDQVARLLGVQHQPDVMAQLVQAATFDNMRADAARFAPSGGSGFFKSDRAFFNHGSNGQWDGHLTHDELSAYDALMSANLTQDARDWLEHGSNA